MKDLVYRHREVIANVEELRQRIDDAAAQIREAIQEIDVCAAFHRRLDACIRARGGHFEQFI